jgi:hypothetical protein
MLAIPKTKGTMKVDDFATEGHGRHGHSVADTLADWIDRLHPSILIICLKTIENKSGRSV